MRFNGHQQVGRTSDADHAPGRRTALQANEHARALNLAVLDAIDAHGVGWLPDGAALAPVAHRLRPLLASSPINLPIVVPATNDRPTCDVTGALAGLYRAWHISQGPLASQVVGEVLRGNQIRFRLATTPELMLAALGSADTALQIAWMNSVHAPEVDHAER